jgi:hypothetical protein
MMGLFDEIATKVEIPVFNLKKTSEGKWILILGKGDVEFEIAGSDSQYFQEQVLDHLESNSGVGMLRKIYSEDLEES